MIDRRRLLMGAGAASLAVTSRGVRAVGKPALTRAKPGSAKAFTANAGPRCRVMVVNDLGGDVDGLVATVHALLSSSAEVRRIVGTAAQGANETSQKAVQNAEHILNLMGLSGKVPIHLGGARWMPDANTPVGSVKANAPTIAKVVSPALSRHAPPLCSLNDPRSSGRKRLCGGRRPAGAVTFEPD